MSAKGRRESEVQAGIIAYLSTRNDVFWWRANTQAGIAPSGQFMRAGVKGQPDILCVQAPTGRLYGIEVKREKGGKVSLDQQRWGTNLISHGGVYLVATCVEEVAGALGHPQVHIVKVGPTRVIPR